MASSKKIGFFWGEEKITIVEFEKNTAHKVISAPLGSKTATQSPFSSNLTEEVQITAILQRMLQDNKITGGSYFVSMPLKEIILRSFIIPFVRPDEIQNTIKFEAKKYIPFDTQDLAFVYHAIPFSEGATKRLQIIFFATRKDVLARYERIFKQVNATVAYCEPYMVSLAKALLFKKEIKPTDHLAFLVLDKNFGRICFIDKGIPQFIREFPITSPFQVEETGDSIDALNLKIINEVGNSFDFYARQFSGDRIDQMIVSSDSVQTGLFDALQKELKVTLKQFSPIVTAGVIGQNIGMDAVYAMGACVVPPVEPLSEFNFLGQKSPKSKITGDFSAILNLYKELVFLFLLCVFLLAGVYVFFEMKLKVVQKEYNQEAVKEGKYWRESIDDIQQELQANTDKLTAYKNIRTASEVSFILLRVASHLPQGAMLNELDVKYDQDDSKGARMIIDMRGDVLKQDPNEQIAVVNQIFYDFKNDKELSKYIKSVDLASLNREEVNGQQVTGFNIHCS